jgi:hypothetical protein
MAYMNQEQKKQLQPKIMQICKKHGIKATLAVRDHRTLVLNVKSGPIDFISNYNNAMSRGYDKFTPATTYLKVNKYWVDSSFDGVARDFINEVLSAMNEGNWDKSEPQYDYFNIGWYVDLSIGQWDKPYILQ